MSTNYCTTLKVQVCFRSRFESAPADCELHAFGGQRMSDATYLHRWHYKKLKRSWLQNGYSPFKKTPDLSHLLNPFSFPLVSLKTDLSLKQQNPELKNPWTQGHPNPNPRTEDFCLSVPPLHSANKGQRKKRTKTHPRKTLVGPLPYSTSPKHGARGVPRRGAAWRGENASFLMDLTPLSNISTSGAHTILKIS